MRFSFVPLLVPLYRVVVGSADTPPKGLPAVDDEHLPSSERSDVVGMNDVAVAGSLAAEAGVVKDVGLLGALHDPLGTGERGDLVWLLELVDDHRAHGAGEAVPDRVVGSKACPRLADEHNTDAAGTCSLDELDGGAPAVG